MATIDVTDEELVIEMHGIDKFWALRSSFTIPLSHIRAVEVRPKDAHAANMKGAIRVGSYIPGHLIAGYYHLSDGLGPNAAAVFEGLEQAQHAIMAWPVGNAAPRAPSHRDTALEHLGRAIDAMRLAAEEAGVKTTDKSSGWAFYELHDAEKTIGIDIVGDKVKRVVIEIEDRSPEDAVKLIEAAVRRKR